MVREQAAPDDAFRIVGRIYKTHEPQVEQPTILDRVRRWPIGSMVILALIVLGCICAPILAGHDPAQFFLTDRNVAPCKEFPFGTDSLGRDLYSMMWYGGRVSLVIGLLGAFLIALIGTVYGCISGTASKRVDAVMMRITELCGSIPTLLFVLILSAVFRTDDILSISVVIGVTGWFGYARIVRGEVHQIRNCEYVLYARSSGGSFLHVMRHHLIPNTISAVMFVTVSSISTCITMESTLSFLGLGLPVDVISWGSMLSLANKALIMNTWWVIVFPGAFIVITLLCITNIAAWFRREMNHRPGNL